MAEEITEEEYNQLMGTTFQQSPELPNFATNEPVFEPVRITDPRVGTTIMPPMAVSSDINVVDPLALRDIPVTGLVDPLLVGTGLAADVAAGIPNKTLQALSFLENAFENSNFFEGLQQDYEGFIGMPSEITDKLRLDIRDVMQIPDPELRAQIAVQKTGDYAGYFTYYKMADLALSRVPGLKRVTKPVFDFFNKEIRRRPGTFIASEFAGIAAETELAARGKSELTQGLVGAGATLFVPSTFRLITKYTPKLTDKEYIKKYGRPAYDNAAQMLQTFALKEGGDTVTSTGRVVDGSPEIIETVNKRSNLPIRSEVTPLEIMTGSKEMGEFELYLLKQAGALKYLNRRDKLYEQELAKLLPKRTGAKSPAEFFRLDRQIKQIELNLDKERTLDLALERLRREKPNASPSEINETIVNALRASYERARVLVDSAWAATDLSAKASATNAKKLLQQLKTQPGIAYNEDIPDLAIKYLDGNIPMKNVGDVYSLYSQLGSFIYSATERGAKISPRAAKYAQDIRVALLKDLDEAKLPGQVAQVAKNLTADYNKLYTRGATGEILGLVDSRKVVPPDPRVAITEASQGVAGDISLEQIAAGIRGLRTPTVLKAKETELMDTGLDAVGEFYRRLFYDAAIDKNTGQVITLNAKNFIAKHIDYFSKPENSALKLQLETAVDEIDALRTAYKGKESAFASRYSKESVGVLNKFLNADVTNRLQSVLFRGDPEGSLKELVKMIDDASPATLKKLNITNKNVLKDGLANSVTETLVLNALKRQPLGNTPKLSSYLDNDEFLKGLKQILKPTEIDNLRLLASEINKYNVYRLKSEGFSVTNDASILQQILGGIAAVFAGKVTGGPASIQAAGAAKRGVIAGLQNLSKGQLQQILGDATRDPKLLKALLMNERTYLRGGKPDLKAYLTKYFISRSIALPTKQEEGETTVNLSVIENIPDAQAPAFETFDMMGK